MPQRAPRRSVDQWHALIDQQQASGLSARAFCCDQDIGYLSFLHWRKRLSAEEHLPTFVNVTPTEISTSLVRTDAGSVIIELDLGDGLSLRICRPG